MKQTNVRHHVRKTRKGLRPVRQHKRNYSSSPSPNECKRCGFPVGEGAEYCSACYVYSPDYKPEKKKNMGATWTHGTKDIPNDYKLKPGRKVELINEEKNKEDALAKREELKEEIKELKRHIGAMDIKEGEEVIELDAKETELNEVEEYLGMEMYGLMSFHDYWYDIEPDYDKLQSNFGSRWNPLPPEEKAERMMEKMLRSRKMPVSEEVREMVRKDWEEIKQSEARSKEEIKPLPVRKGKRITPPEWDEKPYKDYPVVDASAWWPKK